MYKENNIIKVNVSHRLSLNFLNVFGTCQFIKFVILHACTAYTASLVQSYKAVVIEGDKLFATAIQAFIFASFNF